MSLWGPTKNTRSVLYALLTFFSLAQWLFSPPGAINQCMSSSYQVMDPLSVQSSFFESIIMDPATFIASLPAIDLSGLEPQDHNCNICQEQMQGVSFVRNTRYDLRSRAIPEVELTPVGERAVRLPCGHLFGHECIGSWLASKNSCPKCRATVLQHLNANSRPLPPRIASFAEQLDYLIAHSHDFPATRNIFTDATAVITSLLVRARFEDIFQESRPTRELQLAAHNFLHDVDEAVERFRRG